MKKFTKLINEYSESQYKSAKNRLENPEGSAKEELNKSKEIVTAYEYKQKGGQTLPVKTQKTQTLPVKTQKTQTLTVKTQKTQTLPVKTQKTEESGIFSKIKNIAKESNVQSKTNQIQTPQIQNVQQKKES